MRSPDPCQRHLPAENTLPLEVWRDEPRQMSWWRTWQDRGVASLPHQVRESERRAKRRAADEHLTWARDRLEAIYETQVDIRDRLGIPVPPTGRPKRPIQGPRESVSGKFLGEFEDLMAEWDWDFNGDLDPMNLPAGSKVKVAWRCLVNPDHVWETRVAGRTLQHAFCPFHMGNKVHPSESLAAYFPWLAKEWHPTKNDLRPDQVTRASGREVHWICEHGHEWAAVVYSRTLSKSGCPECAKVEGTAKSKASKQRRRAASDARIEAQIASLVPPIEPAADHEPF